MLEFLFERGPRRPERVEPRLDRESAAAAARAVEPAIQSGMSTRPAREWDRMMTPRQMGAWAHEMYLAGWLSWDDYRAAVPTELHPDYDRTVGSLTGETAKPDQPRDMVFEWEERLAFERRYNIGTAAVVKRIERIVSLLRWQMDQGARAQA